MEKMNIQFLVGLNGITLLQFNLGTYFSDSLKFDRNKPKTLENLGIEHCASGKVMASSISLRLLATKKMLAIIM